jgi:hypothetical protein
MQHLIEFVPRLFNCISNLAQLIRKVFGQSTLRLTLLLKANKNVLLSGVASTSTAQPSKLVNPQNQVSYFQVHPGQPHEPGWLGGELNGKVGWFPETYVEKVADQVNPYLLSCKIRGKQAPFVNQNHIFSLTKTLLKADYSVLKRALT